MDMSIAAVALAILAFFLGIAALRESGDRRREVESLWAAVEEARNAAAGFARQAEGRLANVEAEQDIQHRTVMALGPQDNLRLTARVEQAEARACEALDLGKTLDKALALTKRDVVKVKRRLDDVEAVADTAYAAAFKDALVDEADDRVAVDCGGDGAADDRDGRDG